MDHTKVFISLRYWLLGREWTKASEALEYASTFHQGLRKDGVTPEYHHQLYIAQFIRTLTSGLMYPQNTIISALLHDVCEDADVGFEEIVHRFGEDVGRSVKLLTKQHRGSKMDPKSYYEGIATDPVASIVKGVDRSHNIQSMTGVFSRDKQMRYIEETQTFVIPMLKSARRSFPKQELAYENIKCMLTNQLDLITKVQKGV